jgi:hypothetical protein
MLSGVTRKITKVSSHGTARGTIEGSMRHQARPENHYDYGLNHTTLETGYDKSIIISGEFKEEELNLRESGATSVLRLIDTGSELRSSNND